MTLFFARVATPERFQAVLSLSPIGGENARGDQRVVTSRARGKEREAMDLTRAFDESEIRDAERRLEAALEAGGWVSEYTADAVFDGGGEHASVGRESLLAMAKSMRALSAVSIRPLRT